MKLLIVLQIIKDIIDNKFKFTYFIHNALANLLLNYS